MPHKNFERTKNTTLMYAILMVFICIAYFLYNKISTRTNINRTIDDMVWMAQRITDDTPNHNYSELDIDVAVLAEYIPFDLNIKEKGDGYTVKNRFGGEMHIYGAVADKDEQVAYLSLNKNQRLHDRGIVGGSAYIISLSGLNRRVCRVLAQTDWKARIPNFLGLEATNVTKPYYTPLTLNFEILKDNRGIKRKTEEGGIASHFSLTKEEARKACGCFWHSCSIALKFL